VQAGTRREAQFGDLRMVVKRITCGVGGCRKQKQKPIGPRHLATAMVSQQVACAAVVLGPERGSALVTQALGGQRAVDNVGEQQGGIRHMESSHRNAAILTRKERAGNAAASSPTMELACGGATGALGKFHR